MREAGKNKMKTHSLTSEIRIKSKKSDKMKLRYKISIWVALALADSLLCGGSVWLWLAGICAGKVLIRLLFTIALAITVYILTYDLVMVALYAPIKCIKNEPNWNVNWAFPTHPEVRMGWITVQEEQTE